MTAEIEKFREIVEEGQVITPGKMFELDTPYGRIQIIGTQDGFALRRPGIIGDDIRYRSDESLTIDMKDGTKIKISGSAPEDWKASDLLDPIV